MIFALVEVDPIYQTNEKVRINAKQSFITPDVTDPIDYVKIKPSASDNFIVVSDPSNTKDKSYWYLDWAYSAAGTYTVEVEIKAGALVANKTAQLVVKTPASEKLFSKDSDLSAHEHDIMKWLPEDRSSWVFLHRRAQERIMEELVKMKITNVDGSDVTLDQVLRISEFKFWSLYMVLAMAFEGMSDDKEDHFSAKAKKYESKQFEYCTLAMNKLRLDLNKDGIQEDNEGVDGRSTVAWKR